VCCRAPGLNARVPLAPWPGVHMVGTWFGLRAWRALLADGRRVWPDASRGSLIVIKYRYCTPYPSVWVTLVSDLIQSRL